MMHCTLHINANGVATRTEFIFHVEDADSGSVVKKLITKDGRKSKKL